MRMSNAPMRRFGIQCYSSVIRVGWAGCPLLLAVGLLLTAAPSRALAQDESPKPAPTKHSFGRPKMVTLEVETAVKAGLAYLARTQDRDGAWRGSRGYGGGYPTAMTGLAGLAFLSAGNTPIEGRYSSNVRRARDFLMKTASRNSNGLIANIAEERSVMHGHGFAMLFLAEVYGMERDKAQQRKIRKVLVNAIKLTARSQSAAGGWYYQPTSHSDEGSVTVTQIHGLRACRNAGITVPKSVINRSMDYIEKCSNPDGGISYSLGRSGSLPAITAAAVATMYNAGKPEHPVAEKALKYITKLIRSSGTGFGRGHRYYALFYASQAMYLSSTKENKNWEMFYPLLCKDLLALQTTQGQNSGSWNGDSVGTSYGTAIAIVSLQLPYGYLPIFQR